MIERIVDAYCGDSSWLEKGQDEILKHAFRKPQICILVSESGRYARVSVFNRVGFGEDKLNCEYRLAEEQYGFL